MLFFSPHLNRLRRIQIFALGVAFGALSYLLGMNFAEQLQAGLEMDTVPSILFGGIYVGLIMSAFSRIALLRGREAWAIGLFASIGAWSILLIPLGTIAMAFGSAIPVLGFVWIAGHSR